MIKHPNGPIQLYIFPRTHSIKYKNSPINAWIKVTYFSEPRFHILSYHEYTKLAISRFHIFLPHTTFIVPRLVPRNHTKISCTPTQIKTFYIPRLSIDITRLYRFGRLRLPTLDVRGKILKRTLQFGVPLMIKQLVLPNSIIYFSTDPFYQIQK